MTIGFAGAGNMAAALARGLAAHADPGPMLFSDSGSGRAEALAEELGGTRTQDLAELAAESDVILLAVKPKALTEVAGRLEGFSGPVVSVLGATTVADLQAALPQADVLRTMPNVAVEIGRGVICHAPATSPEPFSEILGQLARTARVIEVAEEQLDAATAVMGCAPAYLARACESLIAAGSEAGLDPELSAELVQLAAAGAGDLLLRYDPATLQRAIASPGGSTEAGLEAFAEHRGPEAFAAAVTASLERMAGTR